MGADGCESGAETRCEDSRLRGYRDFEEKEVIMDDDADDDDDVEDVVLEKDVVIRTMIKDNGNNNYNNNRSALRRSGRMVGNRWCCRFEGELDGVFFSFTCCVCFNILRTYSLSLLIKSAKERWSERRN